MMRRVTRSRATCSGLSRKPEKQDLPPGARQRMRRSDLRLAVPGGEAVGNDKYHLTGELLAYTNRFDGREIEVMTRPTAGIERIATSCIAGRLRLLNRV